MRRMTVVATALGVLAFIGSAAAQNPPAQQPQGRTGAPPAQTARPQTSDMTLTGTVVKYDPTTRVLTLTNARGQQETVELGQRVTIQEGSRTLMPADLGAASGKEATVRYAESGGKKVASTVTLAAKPAAASTPPQQRPPSNPPTQEKPPSNPPTQR